MPQPKPGPLPDREEVMKAYVAAYVNAEYQHTQAELLVREFAARYGLTRAQAENELYQAALDYGKGALRKE